MNKCLQRERIIKYMYDTYGTKPEHLWAKTPDASVFRNADSKKWYALIMNISKNKLGLDSEEKVDVLNVKCSPIIIGSLLSKKGFFPAYHMNKNTWISIILDDSVSDENILPLLELSYESVAPKSKK